MEEINMKKYIIAILACTALLSSCKKDFLDKTPLDKLSEEAVFNSDALAENYVNSLYVVLPDPFQEGNISAITDEGFFRYGGTSTRYILSGTMTPDNILPIAEGGQAHDTRTTTLNIWNRTYEWIYMMNTFIKKVGDGTKMSAEASQRLLGEVYFLRAWSYYNLIQRYGGVPIITKIYTLTDEYDVTRDKFDACVDFILSDLDEAEKRLPSKDKCLLGRVNKDVVLALRCRVTMLAASAFFNDPAYPEGDIIHGKYDFDGKWKRAYDAAKAIVDRADKDGAYALAPTYEGIWNDINSKEIIWGKFFVSNADATTNYAKKAQLLYSNVYFNGWTALNPTQAFIKDVEMKNGKKFFEEGSGYDPSHPYANRDPRLYKIVGFPFSYYQNTEKGKTNAELPHGFVFGPTFKGNEAMGYPAYKDLNGVKDGYPSNQLQLYLLFQDKDRSDFEEGKKYPDYTKKAVHLWDAAQHTGCELNKWYIPTSPITESEVGSLLYPWFRLGEMYLNLAECAYMTDKEGECRTYINKVRQRADVMMPEVTESGESLWDRLVNERRVELSFEFIRYFDLRRWKVAEKYENVPLAGMLPMVLEKGGKQDTLYRVVRLYDETKNHTNYYWPNTDASKTYAYATVTPAGDRDGQPIEYIIKEKWLGKEYTLDYGDCPLNISPTPKYFPKRNGVYPNYLMPIPRAEITKSHGQIEQNPGYE